jgi:hypothetical protein
MNASIGLGFDQEERLVCGEHRGEFNGLHALV